MTTYNSNKSNFITNTINYTLSCAFAGFSIALLVMILFPNGASVFAQLMAALIMFGFGAFSRFYLKQAMKQAL
jgi:hypothetical protein